MSKILIITLFLLFVFLAIRFENNRFKRFLSGAGKVSGEITGKEEQLKRTDQPNRTDCFVYYNYNVDGVSYTGRDNVEYPDLWLDMKEGQGIEVYYSKTNPTDSHPAMLVDRRVKNIFGF
jgi:hypothetical protein